MEKKDFDCSFNDDEVFFGRLTLKEVKKRIFMDVHQKYSSRLADCDDQNYEGNDIKIIETSSQPNMFSAIGNKEGVADENLKSTSDPVFNRYKQHTQSIITPNADCENRDSFLELEEKVTEQCKSPNNANNNLDNTLEFVDFILKHAESQGKNIQVPKVIKQESCDSEKGCNDKSDEATKNEMMSQSISDHKIDKSTCSSITPIKCDQNEKFSTYKNLKPEVTITLNTPISSKKEPSNLFKTPKMMSSRKVIGAKKTPSRSKAYEHIASPIATYIRNSPQVPLVKEIHPKKPLPSTSLIPKLLKNAQENKCDKENIVLPPLAYRNAKKTLVIDVNKEKLPQSNWAQKLTSLPRKPIVLKHNHREAVKKPLSLQQQQEDSFQDLTLHQADVSICTQKLAFQKL